MVKLTFIFVGLFIIIHFTLYYWNIDPLNVYNNKKTLKEELNHVINEGTNEVIINEGTNEVINEDTSLNEFDTIRSNLEECLNELKQYNTSNVNNDSSE